MKPEVKSGAAKIDVDQNKHLLVTINIKSGQTGTETSGMPLISDRRDGLVFALGEAFGKAYKE